MVSCKPAKIPQETLSGRLRTFLTDRAPTEEDPTVILHLIAVMGGEKVQDQNLPVLFAKKYLREETVEGKKYYEFPPKEGEKPIEPHTNQFLKVCQDSGFSGALKGTITTDTLVNHARALFRFKADKLKDDLGWSLLVFSRAGVLQWKNAWGEEVKLREVATLALDWLVDLTIPVEKARAKGKFFKKTELHQWYCTGFHLFQAVLGAYKAGVYTEDKKKEVKKQIGLLFYRLQKEPGLYWTELENKKSKNVKLSLYLSLLKFYGHFFEVMGYAREIGIWKADEKERGLIEKNLKIFRKILQWLVDQGFYGDVNQLRKKWGDRFYRDLLNDSCHALRAMDMWHVK